MIDETTIPLPDFLREAYDVALACDRAHRNAPPAFSGLLALARDTISRVANEYKALYAEQYQKQLSQNIKGVNHG